MGIFTFCNPRIFKVRTDADIPNRIIPFEVSIHQLLTDWGYERMAANYVKFQEFGVLSFSYTHEQVYLLFAVGIVALYITWVILSILASLSMAIAGGIILSCFEGATQAGVYTDFLTKSTNRVFSGCCKRVCSRLKECFCRCDCAYCCECCSGEDPVLENLGTW